MEYIGTKFRKALRIFRNKEYTAAKRPPHEDIKIKEQYDYTPKTIKASQIITDTGDSEESSISRFSLDIDRLTGDVSEIESISNKKTLSEQV